LASLLDLFVIGLLFLDHVIAVAILIILADTIASISLVGPILSIRLGLFVGGEFHRECATGRSSVVPIN
jgi:hypothetical protein